MKSSHESEHLPSEKSQAKSLELRWISTHCFGDLWSEVLFGEKHWQGSFF
jgi:hypothetical protein